MPTGRIHAVGSLLASGANFHSQYTALTTAASVRMSDEHSIRRTGHGAIAFAPSSTKNGGRQRAQPPGGHPPGSGWRGVHDFVWSLGFRVQGLAYRLAPQVFSMPRKQHVASTKMSVPTDVKQHIKRTIRSIELSSWTTQNP